MFNKSRRKEETLVKLSTIFLAISKIIFKSVSKIIVLQNKFT